MTSLKERFRKVFHWQEVEKIPDVEFGYWDETISFWHNQGLPEFLKTNVDIEKYLYLEGLESIPTLPVSTGIFPSFERKIIEKKNDREIIIDEEGNLCEISESFSSIPKYIKYGLETKKDWQRYKNKRLNYKDTGRIGNIKNVAGEADRNGYPLKFFAGSLYGWLRNWMGLENLSIALITEKKWVEEMMEHLTEMIVYLVEKSLPGVHIDFAWWWEDMCYNAGPLISPGLFEELMVPRYRRITDVLKKYGVDVNILDCDGKIYELVPGWLSAGINCMFPVESAHTDPCILRKEYGRDLLMIGGVNKIEVAKGRDAIDKEIGKLRSLIEQGGYIPCFDHRVPPDVSFENYVYYLKKKREILGLKN